MPDIEFMYVVRNNKGDNLVVCDTPEKAAAYIAGQSEWATHMMHIQLVVKKG